VLLQIGRRPGRSGRPSSVNGLPIGRLLSPGTFHPVTVAPSPGPAA